MIGSSLRPCAGRRRWPVTLCCFRKLPNLDEEGAGILPLFSAKTEMPNDSASPPDQLHEEDALLMLSRRDLPQAAIASLTRQERLLGYYRVKVALVSHPNTPRTVSLALLRHLYLEDLVKVDRKSTR